MAQQDAENEEVLRQLKPERETRQPDEKKPDYYQRQLEQEGWSEWSGGRWGGRQ